MGNKKKTYFYATELINKDTDSRSLVFTWDNWMWAHWAGGGEWRVNFVLEKLVQNNGKEKGIEIYQKFNQALIDISADEWAKNWAFPKSCLVVYRKINDSEISDPKWDLS